MGNVTILPRIRMTVEQFSGYVDHGGQHYGFQVTIESRSLRIWRIVDGVYVAGKVPSEVSDWAQRTAGRVIEAWQSA